MLSAAQARYNCILNDDTVVLPCAFERIVEFMDANLDVGVVGPRLLNPDGSSQPSAFRLPPVWLEPISLCLLPPPLGRLKCIVNHPAQNASQPERADWLIGACLVIRSETLAQVGLLDEWLAPIANWEDTDWCRRVWASGWSVWYLPTAEVIHIGGQSLWTRTAGVDLMRVEMMRGNLRFRLKYGGWLAAAFLALSYLLTLPWNLLMILQMTARKRLIPSVAAGNALTFIGIACAGLEFFMGDKRYRYRR